MKKSSPVPFAFILAGLAYAGGARLSATSPAVQPSTPYLTITREFVKPGQSTALVREKSSNIRALGPVAWPQTTVGLVAVTGTEEVWYLNFYPTLGALEKYRADLAELPHIPDAVDRMTESEGSFLSDRRILTAYYFKDYSYRPEFDWAQMRYLDAISIHVRPGHHLEYLEMRKIALAGHNKGGLDTHLPIFKVTSGEPGNTYLILRPLASLDGHDDLRAKGFGEPLTPEENQRMIALQALSVDHEEEQFFRVEPRISFPSADWVSSDPGFWTVAR